MAKFNKHDFVKFTEEAVKEFSFEEAANVNIEKLKARFPDGFSTENSIHRADGDI